MLLLKKQINQINEEKEEDDKRAEPETEIEIEKHLNQRKIKSFFLVRQNT
jgi:hypothetical protein